MRFVPFYLYCTILLFLIELTIALYFDDAFIRSYVGDVLVVILIYTLLRTFLRIPILPTAIGVLIFSFFVEILQYFQIVDVLGLQSITFARVVIGTSFDYKDLAAYSCGFLLLLFWERSAGRFKSEWRVIPARDI
ncbi:MAG: DUF2809 domain-containing protein [Paracoccaceae bacterium]